MTSLQSIRVATRSFKLTSQFNFDRSNFTRGALIPAVGNSSFFANFASSARMSANENYQEKVQDLPGMKFPEADAKQPDHEKKTHHEQHEKVRESEELGGYTDEAQADAAAKSAAYFEFRQVIEGLPEGAPDPETLSIIKSMFAHQQGSICLCRKGANEAQKEGSDKEDAHKKAQWANKQTGTGGFTDTESK